MRLSANPALRRGETFTEGGGRGKVAKSELIGRRWRIITNVRLITDTLTVKSTMVIVSQRVTESEVIGGRSGITTNLRLIKEMLSLQSSMVIVS
jgi:hypothetical protein